MVIYSGNQIQSPMSRKVRLSRILLLQTQRYHFGFHRAARDYRLDDLVLFFDRLVLRYRDGKLFYRARFLIFQRRYSKGVYLQSLVQLRYPRLFTLPRDRRRLRLPAHARH